MPISLSARLRQFAQEPLLSNPAVAQSTLARATEITRSAATGFGAGFLAPAVDSANDQARQFDFLIKLEQLRQQQESNALSSINATTSNLLNQARLAQVLNENDPKVRAARLAAESQAALDRSLKTQSETQLINARLKELEDQQAISKQFFEIFNASSVGSPNGTATVTPSAQLGINQPLTQFTIPQEALEVLQNNNIDPSGITSQEALQNALDSIGNGTGNLDPAVNDPFLDLNSGNLNP